MGLGREDHFSHLSLSLCAPSLFFPPSFYKQFSQFAGFCEIYSLQTGSDPEETWSDLKRLG